MLIAIRKRLQDKEEGFTLIELMVVVLIIAILIAIAIPTFLGARKRAQDRAAQSNIRNAFTAEKTIYTDAQAYAAHDDDLDGSGSADLAEIEPSLTFVNTDPPTATGNTVSIVLVGSTVYVMGKSASGACFYLRDNATGATEYAKDTANSPCLASGGALTWSTTPW
ncbi:MAG TPA: prepilin-type N-terminal cleavage/methylation domain-containing protein [Actinomycetota bacterium]|nr:prepilin-type N-terminal cleavage/methylation domain-containing protein [Actinomycetota bacterium]